MGLINAASSIVDRVVNLERSVEAIRKLAGLTSAIISRGGLSLLNDSFIKMVSGSGVQILFVGPDDLGRQVWELKRGDGSRLMRTAFHTDGNVYWAFYDRRGNILMSDDAETGYGLATPWQPVPMYPKAWPTAFQNQTSTDLFLPVSACNGGMVWEGRIAKVVCARIWTDMVCGRGAGTTGNPTYRLFVAGVEVGNWNQVTYGPALHGPYDIIPWMNFENVPVHVTVSATGTGTDLIAAQMLGTHCRGG
jgi:hypothetical protein